MIGLLKKNISVLLTMIKHYDSVLGFQVIIKASSVKGNCMFENRVQVRTSSIGEFVEVHENTKIFGCSFAGNNKVGAFCSVYNVEMGKFSYINDYSFANNVSIGKFCSIGPNFKVGYGTHPINFISTSPAFYSQNGGLGGSFAKREFFTPYQKAFIGNDVWIGANVFINEGVTIGDGAIIGAGAVVTKNVPPYAIVGGVPAKVLRYRFNESIIENLLNSKWWELDEEWLKANNEYFTKQVTTISDIPFNHV